MLKSKYLKNIYSSYHHNLVGIFKSIKFNENFAKHFANKEEIEKKLRASLKIDELEVIDTSGNCGTNFSIKIKSPDFKGKTMIQQHRRVNEILTEDMKDIHALQLKTSF
jgi:stress-induced morphogen